MGLFGKLFGGGSAASDLTVRAPFQGSVMKLEDVPDPVFSQGILGPGCGVEPSEETVYAPFDGTVSQTTPTKHAVGVTSASGIELLIHVGLDTVDMAGKGFNCLVKEGDKVKAGEPLMTFTIADIKEAGHPATTAVIVTNADDFASLETVAIGAVSRGDAILRLTK